MPQGRPVPLDGSAGRRGSADDQRGAGAIGNDPPGAVERQGVGEVVELR
jgi:hypothetical protein